MLLLGGWSICHVDDTRLRITKSIREIISGIWKAQKLSLAEPLRKKRAYYDDALFFVTLGNLIGYPALSTYYSRLILAYMLPQFVSWRRRVLKERDVLDRMSE